MQMVTFRGHLTGTQGPSPISGNRDKIQEILEFSAGNNAVVVNLPTLMHNNHLQVSYI